MKKTALITFPCSGKRLFIYALQRYFAGSESFEIIIPPYSPPVSIKKLQLCQYNEHCNTMPCTDSETNLQLLHGLSDKEFKLKNVPELNYIYLYRNPISSMASWGGYGHYPVRMHHFDSWVDYFTDRVALWKNWIHNWVLDNKNSNFIHLSYENLIENPKDKFKEIIQFMQPEKQVEMKLLERVIKSMDIKSRKKITDFLCYKELSKLLKDLELTVEEELKELNIEKVIK